MADTVTVLRDGHSVAEGRPLSGYTKDEVVDLMVGRAYASVSVVRRAVDAGAAPALRLSEVDTASGHQGVSLAVRPGEILGLYGLVGAGRSELAKALLGLDRIAGGTVEVHGQPVRIRDVGEALHRYGIGYVTENRKEEGLFLDQPITRKIAVTVCRRPARAGLVRERAERAVVADYQERLSIRLASPRQVAGQLSGGNQQKVSLAKWLAADCTIFVVDEPTVGIDVRTKAAFHELIAELADRGLAILLISSDLPEVVTLADRIAVMSDFAIRGEVVNDHTTRVHIGATGVEVTRLGLGLAPIGGLFTAVGDEQAYATIERAWQLGIRYFDTAPLYGSGLSERRAGRALAGRDGFSLSTKVGRRLVDSGDAGQEIWAESSDAEPVWDFSATGVRQSYVESLARLGRSRVDILHLHDPDDHFAEAVSDALPALVDLRDAGRVGAVSAGMNQAPMLAEFARTGLVDCLLLAGRYSLIDQSGLDELLPLCHERGISVIVGGVFNHLHEHFVDPAIVADGRYAVPAMPGFSAQMKPETLRRYAFPDGAEWSSPG